MKIKIVALLCVVLVCFALLGGCGWLEQLQDWKNGDGEEEVQENNLNIEQPLQQLPNQEAPLPNQGEVTTEEEQEQQVELGETRDVVLYFASADGASLEGEVRAIPRQEGMARATLNQLIAGPKISGLLPTIPTNTILEDINIRDGICIVDFSSDIVSDHPGGLQNEQLTVYSIVNTLSQFESIEQVRILVNGQEVSSLAGHVDVSEAMAPYLDIIK